MPGKATFTPLLLSGSARGRFGPLAPSGTHPGPAHRRPHARLEMGAAQTGLGGYGRGAGVAISLESGYAMAKRHDAETGLCRGNEGGATRAGAEQSRAGLAASGRSAAQDGNFGSSRMGMALSLAAMPKPRARGVTCGAEEMQSLRLLSRRAIPRRRWCPRHSSIWDVVAARKVAVQKTAYTPNRLKFSSTAGFWRQGTFNTG